MELKSNIPGTVSPEYTYKRAVLLGVDGAGNFFKEAETPNIDRIFANGATSYNVMTALPTISAECWGSMLIGSSAAAHGLTNSIVSSIQYDVNSPLPSVFRRIKESNPDAVLASFCNWNPINVGIVENNLGVTYGTGGDDTLTDDIIAYLKENDPTFLFVQFDSVDGMGHGTGYGSVHHLNQITTVDSYIGRIYDTMAERGLLEDTLFMVIADHGGTPGGSHGGNTDAEKYVFFGAVGNTVEKGQIGEMNVRDAAAVILYAFGIDIPEFDFDGFSGQIPENIFKGYVPEPRQNTVTPPNERKAIPTPVADSGKYITDFIDKSKLEAVFFFDRNADDIIGKTKVEVIGKPKYYDIGYYGACIEIGEQGNLLLPDLKLGTSSFTVSTWIYIDGSVATDPPIFCTKNWGHGEAAGCTFAYRSSDLRFHVGNGDAMEEYVFPYPESISRGWNNTTLVVDREQGKITHYYNFQKSDTMDISDTFKDVCYDELPFHIGQDGLGTYNINFNFLMDDFIFYRGAMTEDDIANLAKYYEYEIK